jgi:hypothetical protein
LGVIKDSKYHFLRIAQGLFLLNMFIWLGLGVTSLVRLDDGGVGSTTFLVIALMVMGNAILMGVAAWWLGKRNKWGYLFALSLLGVNIITTFTDQVGFWDYATVLVDIVLFLLLISKRKVFVK